LPTTVAPGGTSLVTTAPAPIIAPLPTRRPHKIVAFDPIETSSSIQVSSCSQSSGPCGVPSGLHGCGCRSLVNITPCPTDTRSPMCTPPQMNECDEILQ